MLFLNKKAHDRSNPIMRSVAKIFQLKCVGLDRRIFQHRKGYITINNRLAGEFGYTLIDGFDYTLYVIPGCGNDFQQTCRAEFFTIGIFCINRIMGIKTDSVPGIQLQRQRGEA